MIVCAGITKIAIALSCIVPSLSFQTPHNDAGWWWTRLHRRRHHEYDPASSRILRHMMSIPQNDNGDEDVPASDAAMENEFAWRAEKIRLEEANTRRFLNRKPYKLSYIDARRWVQANLGASTEEEFNDLVANGNLRSPYLSKRPDVHYTETGDWKGWDHFLTGFFEEAASGISPSTGAFD
jgi:hypothetical protein